MIRKLVTGLVATVGMAFAAPVMADPITLDEGDVGTSFSIDLNGFSGDSGSTIDGLTARLTLTLLETDNGSYTFGYTVDNTTSAGLTSNISSFAFDVDPDISGATVDGAYRFSFVTDGRASDPSYPNQIGSVDVCFKARSSGSCSNGGGVSQGDSGSGTLTLLFDSDASEITLSDFFVRYQGITGAGNVTSATGGQTSTSGGMTTTSSGTPVPAPGMLGLLAIALASLGFMRRRRGLSKPSAQPAYA